MESEEEVRKTLDEFFEKAKTTEDLNNLEFIIDDYIEDGYDVRDYIPKYNLLVQKFYSNKK